MVSYSPETVKGFDVNIYYVKRADGTVCRPAEGMFNDVTCFCDARAIREDPELVAVSENGLALRRNRRLNLPWDYVCPTHEGYRAGLRRFLEDLGKENVEGVILNLYHFPEESFCTCPRCRELQRKSGLGWMDWRVKTVTDFVEEARELVGGSKAFAVEIWPDPVLSRERFGVDFDMLSRFLDFFHVPLSAHDYTTMYWVDMLTRIFVRILDKPVYVELSAEMPGDARINGLLKTMAYVSRHDVEGIFLLVYDKENARRVCEYAVRNVELQNWFRTHGFSRMLEIVDQWRQIYG
ncbi:hypothetical protein H5T51_00385 [Candidatus Bathyarchaeota archaeon]|nr:hypothetical protein [Candidatus Bathyarchaeota archaeon]